MSTMRLIPGDMREVLARLISDGVRVSAVVCDPPYHLTSIVRRFGADKAAAPKPGKTGAYARASAGFMGKKWDDGDVATQPDTWRLCFDLLPPGGYLIAFSGTRTYHRVACAIEDAGFEIRDMISWLYGSGFPKSHDVSKGIDRASAASAASAAWEGWGTALKPAFEPICLARKPLSGTVASNVLAHGVGALNIDGCRVPSEQSDGGRWPANVTHDGSEEVVRAFPETQSTVPGKINPAASTRHVYEKYSPRSRIGPRDSNSAARFFYNAKADAGDRLGSKHPTVKPVDLMRWLVRLVTPPGGTVLDPFAGSGTTGMACMAEGLDCIMVEREAEYVEDIRRRIAHVRGEDAPLFSVPQ